jgi:hypothetical protein
MSQLYLRSAMKDRITIIIDCNGVSVCVAFRTSGGKGMKPYANWTTARPRKNMSPGAVGGMGAYNNSVSQMMAEKEAGGSPEVPRIQKAALYIFGEKNQIKVSFSLD